MSEPSASSSATAVRSGALALAWFMIRLWIKPRKGDE